MKQSDCYIMKCPVIMSRRRQECVYCQPTFIQLKGSEACGWGWGSQAKFPSQRPWLLSLKMWLGPQVAASGDMCYSSRLDIHGDWLDAWVRWAVV